MHIYAFGSVCRGEIDKSSDIDLLAITEQKTEIDPNVFSIYSYQRIEELWKEGNPFAWHLAFESKLIFSNNRSDFIDSLGVPNEYVNTERDCFKFKTLFVKAVAGLEADDRNYVFELSNIYLSIRNFATCFGLGRLGLRDFSRYSPLHIGGDSLAISEACFNILLRARILCTRGRGYNITREEFAAVTSELRTIENWLNLLNHKITNGRIQ